MNTPSVAVQIIVSIIPIVGIVFGSVVIFFYLFWNYKMKMLMIEKGNFQRAIERFDLESFALLAGLVLTGVGLGMVGFFYMKAGISYGLLGGTIPLSIGASLVLYFVIKTVLNRKKDE